jgi:hypothetical protein
MAKKGYGNLLELELFPALADNRKVDLLPKEISKEDATRLRATLAKALARNYPLIKLQVKAELVGDFWQFWLEEPKEDPLAFLLNNH